MPPLWIYCRGFAFLASGGALAESLTTFVKPAPGLCGGGFSSSLSFFLGEPANPNKRHVHSPP